MTTMNTPDIRDSIEFPLVSSPGCYGQANWDRFLNQSYHPDMPEEWKGPMAFRAIMDKACPIKLKDILKVVPGDFDWNYFQDFKMCPTNFTGDRADILNSGQQLPVCNKDLTDGKNTYTPKNTAIISYSRVGMPMDAAEQKESIAQKLTAINEAPKVMMDRMKEYNDPQYLYRYYDRNRSLRCLVDSLNGIAGGICGYESALAMKELYKTHDTVVAHRIQIYTVAYGDAKLRNHYAIIYLTKQGIIEAFEAMKIIKDELLLGMRLDTILAKELRYYSKANGLEEDCRWSDKIDQQKLVYFMLCNADDDGQPNLFCHDTNEKDLCKLQVRALCFARRMFRSKFYWRQAASMRANPARMIAMTLCYYKLMNKPLYNAIMRRTDEAYEKVHQEICEGKLKKFMKKDRPKIKKIHRKNRKKNYN